MLGLLSAILAVWLGAQDATPELGLQIQSPGATALERCARRTLTEPRQSLQMRCKISNGRVDGDCELMNGDATTSRHNIAAAQCILRATKWTRRDGSPANGVVSIQTYTLGTD